VVVDVESDSESGIESVTLVEANENSASFQGSIALSQVDDSGVLLVNGGDTITVTYVDPDDGEGGINLSVIDQATVDCAAPQIFNVQATEVTGQGAIITWQTDEPSDSLVTYGIDLPDLTEGVDGLVNAHVVELRGLEECSVYSFSVTSVDQVGNSATHDNAGAYHAFETGKNVNPTYTTLEPPVSIPDNSPTGAEMSIFVSDDEPIVDVNAEIYVTHTYTGDLEVSLIGPDGTEVTLSDRHGGSGNNFDGTIFDDEATTAIGSGAAPFTGSFRPDDPLSTFDGRLPTGEWRLRVEDHAGADVGTIDTWSLQLTYPAQACGPHLEHESFSLIDSCAGFGGSSSPGSVDPGEDVLLNVVLHNDGTGDLNGITAWLATETPGVTITQPVFQYPDLAAGEIADSALNPFAFTVDVGVPCGVPIDFELDLSADEGTWVDPFSIVVGGTLGSSLCANCYVPLPGAVPNLSWEGKASLAWDAVSAAKFYRLFRGEWVDLPSLLDGTEDSCRRLTTAALESGEVLHDEPAADSSFWYLICAGNGGGEGPVGNSSAGPRILNAGAACP
jgi:subtilisin-like proprotein convertase family protein